jgi:hypothetical protein
VRGNARRAFGWGACALAALGVGVFAWQASSANSALRNAAVQANMLSTQVASGDADRAARTLADVQASTRQAATRTDGPLWALAAKVPWLGRNAHAVREISATLDHVTHQALPPVVQASQDLGVGTFSARKGRIDVQAIATARPVIVAAERDLRQANQRVQAIDPQQLLVPLRGPVTTLRTTMADATAVAAQASRAARLLPQMLGNNGPRTYAMIVQNNAEARSGGGIVGAFALLSARDGRLRMDFQGSYRDMTQFARPVVKLTREERAVVPASMARNILDVTATPDFPRTGQIVRRMVKQKFGRDVDGVISVDPVALSYVLAGTGPVELKGKNASLDHLNAVGLLLNSTYLLVPDPAEQDDIFKEAARAVFDALTSGRGDQAQIIRGLVQGVGENRIAVWSRHKREQRIMGRSGISGALPGDDGRTPHVGVYLGDAASTKMLYYLEHHSGLSATSCRAGVQEWTLRTDLRARTPAKVSKLPVAVTGDGTYTPPGTMRVVVRIYAPFGGAIEYLALDGVQQTVYADTHHGRNVTRVVLTLQPGATHNITARIQSAKGQTDAAVLALTPGVAPLRNNARVASACG